MYWTEFQLKLIKMVQQFPVLYDKTMPGHDKQQRTYSAWKSVSNNLDIKAMKCYNTWNHIRLNYIKAIEKNSRSPKWIELSFLKPYISCNKTGNQDPVTTNGLHIPNQVCSSLIQSVQRYPVLYGNRKVTKEARKLIWENISEDVGSDPISCETNWKYLTRQYRDELLNHEGNKSKCPYFDSLSFLKEHILLDKSKPLSPETNDENLQFMETASIISFDDDDYDDENDDDDIDDDNEVYDINFWSRSNDIKDIQIDKIKSEEIPANKSNSLDESSCNVENIESFKKFLQNKLLNCSREKKNKAMLDIMEYVIGIEMDVNGRNMDEFGNMD